MTAEDLTSWGPHRGTTWSTGPWSAELRGDEIADLRYQSVLVTRSLRGVLRDRNWATVPVSVLSTTSNGERIDDYHTATTTLQLRYDGYGITSDAELTLRTEGDRLVITFILTATGSFDTNRTGLVLLHPPQLAGTPLHITHDDGSTEHTQFPDRISPHQPALDITALGWSFNGLDLTARFHGESFEMEDQRNWTDASFKTYSRPLALPFPYPLHTGDVIAQRIELGATPVAGVSLHPTPPSMSTSPRNHIRLIDADRPAPQVGVGHAAHELTGPGTPAPVDVVLLEIEDHDPDPGATLARAATSARHLDVRLVTDSPARTTKLVETVAPFSPVRLAVFSAKTHVTEPELWEALVRAVTDHGINTEMLGGARSHFTELNRTHQRLPSFPSWTISITPQMHARDTFQIEESIAMQRRVVADTVSITQGAPLHVGPITLRPRFNAVGTIPTQHPHPTTVDPTTVDARQTEPRLSAWTIASAAALAEGGATSITWFEETGPRGITNDDGTPFPVRDAIAAVHAISGKPLLVPSTTSTDESLTWVLGARTPSGARLLIARLGDTAEDVLIDVDGHEVSITGEPGTWQAVDLDFPLHTTREHSS